MIAVHRLSLAISPRKTKAENDRNVYLLQQHKALPNFDTLGGLSWLNQRSYEEKVKSVFSNFGKELLT